MTRCGSPTRNYGGINLSVGDPWCRDDAAVAVAARFYSMKHLLRHYRTQSYDISVHIGGGAGGLGRRAAAAARCLHSTIWWRQLKTGV